MKIYERAFIFSLTKGTIMTIVAGLVFAIIFSIAIGVDTLCNNK